MERSLLWSVLALGWAGWLCGFLLARVRLVGAAKRLSVIPPPYLIAALVLPLLVFLATLPSRPPLFETGHGLGNGFLLGGLGALLAALVPLLSAPDTRGETNPLRSAATLAAPQAMALAMTAVPLLMLRDTLLDVLLGIAISWFCVTVILYVGLLHRRKISAGQAAHEIALSPALPLSLLSGVSFVALLCALAALGEIGNRVAYAPVPEGVSLSAFGLIFAAGVPILLLLTALPNRIFLQMAQARTDGARLAGTPAFPALPLAAVLWRTVLAVGALAVLGRLLSRHLLEKELPKSGGALQLLWLALGPSHLFHVMAIGLLAGLMAWWLTASRVRQEREAEDTNAGWQNGALAVLTLLAGFMLAFQIARGLGVALMLTGAWISFALAMTFALERAEWEPTETPHPSLQTASDLLRLSFLGALLLLYRLVTTRFDAEASGNALTDHYALFGLLVGGVLPSLLAGFLARQTTPSSGIYLFRLVCAGAILLAVPTMVIVLWGAKCVLTLLLGLALSIALELVRGRTLERDANTATALSASPLFAFLPSLFAVGTGLALSQWLGHVLAISDLTRAEKVHVLAYIVVGLAVLVLLADYSGRFLTRKPGSTLPTDAKGAVS